MGQCLEHMLDMAMAHFPSPARPNLASLDEMVEEIPIQKLSNIKAEISTRLAKLHEDMLNADNALIDRHHYFMEYQATLKQFKIVSTALISLRIKSTTDEVNALMAGNPEFNKEQMMQASDNMCRLSEVADGAIKAATQPTDVQSDDIATQYQRHVQDVLPSKVGILCQPEQQSQERPRQSIEEKTMNRVVTNVILNANRNSAATMVKS
jgi:hypothetical protein